MSEKFLIEGGKKLRGEVEIRGAKNAAGSLLAATILTDKECILSNLPKISDILNLLDILKTMGKEIEWIDERKVKIKGGDINPANLDFEKVSQSRVSVLLIGALLPRVKEFKISRPGGDRIGLRPITTHLQALKELGAEINQEGDFYHFKSERKLQGKEIILPEFSVTATENLIMAASLAEGETIIKGAAQEPQVQDLAKMLQNMGAEIEGIGTHTLKIKGVKEMKGTEHRIIPDPLEAGTFIIMGAATGGKIRLKNVSPEHLDLFLAKLEEIGVEIKKNNDSVEVSGGINLKPARVQALPYPGFPTDLLPLIVPLLTQAPGKSLIHDPLYENRLNFVHQLRKMGANIEIVDPHRAFIFGKTPLQGLTIESWDIRAGAALVVAALMATGATTIENIGQIDRGYENIEERLQALGAEIKRVKNN